MIRPNRFQSYSQWRAIIVGGRHSFFPGRWGQPQYLTLLLNLALNWTLFWIFQVFMEIFGHRENYKWCNLSLLILIFSAWKIWSERASVDIYRKGAKSNIKCKVYSQQGFLNAYTVVNVEPFSHILQFWVDISKFRSLVWSVCHCHIIASFDIVLPFSVILFIYIFKSSTGSRGEGLHLVLNMHSQIVQSFKFCRIGAVTLWSLENTF